jgi:pilus assembly protein CpaE
MKVVIISSSEASGGQIRASLPGGSDQVQTLFRIDQALRLERIDMHSTDVIIIDSEMVIDEDIRVISSLVNSSGSEISFIYICNESSQSQLVHLMRAGVADVIHKPFESRELIEALDRIRGKKLSLSGQKNRVISFLSSKGGAGATFLASNLGYILATEFHKKVLFIDLHMQGGDAAFYLTSSTSPNTVADIAKNSELDSMMVTASSITVEPNYFLLQAPDSPEKAAGLLATHIDNLISVAASDFDYVILDVPHLLDGLTIKALDRSDLIFVVTQPIMTYLKAVNHILHLFSRLEYSTDKVRVLLNRMDNVGVLSVARVEDSIQKKIDLQVPNDFLNSVEAVNLGVPIVKIASDAQITNSIREIAREVTGEEVQAVKKSFLQKIFS